MSTKKPTIGHDELMHSLAEHLRSTTDRLVWTDMQLGPWGSPRPDLWTVNKSYAHTKPIAYECKVSVADFRADVTKGKWQSYLDYSSGVIFATPTGLISKDDLPKGCGLIVYNGSRWTNLKGPTLQACPEFLSSLAMKLLIDGIKRQEHTPPRLRKQWDAEAAIRKKYGEAVATYARDKVGFPDAVDRLKKDYEWHRDYYAKAQEEDRLKHQQIVDENYLELLSILKMKPTGQYFWSGIRSQVRELAAAVDTDAEVQALRSRLANIRSALDHQTPNQSFLQP